MFAYCFLAKLYGKIGANFKFIFESLIMVLIYRTLDPHHIIKWEMVQLNDSKHVGDNE